MKEIGGYFEMERYFGEEYHQDLVKLNSGRNALKYIIDSYSIKSILIPFYLCGCIRDTALEKGCEVEYYNIDKEFKPILEPSVDSGTYIYIVNYFGQLSESYVKYLADRYGNIILDNTQSFFRKPIQNVITMYSCRKYFGVTDGSYLSINKERDFELLDSSSYIKMGYIFKRFEESASSAYNLYLESENLISNEDIKRMSKITENILRSLDYDLIIKKRNDNWSRLNESLKKYNKIDVKLDNGPFCYPLLVDNGKKIKELLIKDLIYIPTLWPDVLVDNENSSENVTRYSRDLIPIPCDQRYGFEEIDIVISKIIELIKSINNIDDII